MNTPQSNDNRAGRAPLAVSVSAVVDAPPDRVYERITDIAKMHELSPENTSGEWIGGATEARVGARFKGTNRLGSLKWSTKPTVTVAEPGRRFAFKVPGRSGAEWSYELTPVEGGTLVVESMCQQRRSPLPIRLLQRRAGVTDRAAHLHAGMTTTLERLAAACGRDDQGPHSADRA